MLSLQRFKCTVVGNYGVGKTSLLRNFVDLNTAPVKSTIGIDFFLKTVKIYDQEVRISLWDTAGAERFHSLTYSYLKDSTVLFIVYDLGDSDCQRQVADWLNTVEACEVQPEVVCILGNKNDVHQTSPASLTAVLDPYLHHSWTIITGTTTKNDDSFGKYVVQCLTHFIGQKHYKQTLRVPKLNIWIQSPPPRTCCT
jgi:small GTP-binding protein